MPWCDPGVNGTDALQGGRGSSGNRSRAEVVVIR